MYTLRVKVYIDMSALQRPLDAKSHPRIAVEAEAILGVIALCESGKLELVSSESLLFELSRNPNPIRKRYASEVLSHSTLFISVNDPVENRASDLNAKGVKPLDALHLACAEEAGVDYFCTCDDRLLKKARSMKDFKMKVVSPIELIQEIHT